MLAFDDDQGIRLRTATAERWLALIQESHTGTGRPYPFTLMALISKARAAGPGAHVQSRALTSTGHWIALSAWREPAPDAGDSPDMLTYVSLAPSHPGELAAIVLDAYGCRPARSGRAFSRPSGHIVPALRSWLRRAGARRMEICL